MRIEATPHQACSLSRLRERAGVRDQRLKMCSRFLSQIGLGSSPIKRSALSKMKQVFLPPPLGRGRAGGRPHCRWPRRQPLTPTLSPKGRGRKPIRCRTGVHCPLSRLRERAGVRGKLLKMRSCFLSQIGL